MEGKSDYQIMYLSSCTSLGKKRQPNAKGEKIPKQPTNKDWLLGPRGNLFLLSCIIE